MIKSLVYAGLIGVFVFAAMLVVQTKMASSENLEGSLLSSSPMTDENVSAVEQDVYTFVSENGDLVYVSKSSL